MKKMDYKGAVGKGGKVAAAAQQMPPKKGKKPMKPMMGKKPDMGALAAFARPRY